VRSIHLVAQSLSTGAPGYCITRVELERDRLWVDRVAQDGFVSIWGRVRSGR